MLDRSPLSDDTLLAFARDHFGRPATAVTFLPLGYDANAYRLVAGETYLLKVRRGPAALPGLLARTHRPGPVERYHAHGGA